MGKSTRKAKTGGDVSLLEVSPSSAGVRTRAKTLALQRLQSDASLAPSPCYMELRTRRLQKVPVQQNSRKARQGCGCGRPEAGKDEEGSRLGLTAGSIEVDGLEIQASFGENDVSRSGGRSSRESTACSLIRAGDTISPCDSTRKQASSSDVADSGAFFMEIPSMAEWEKFFALEEQTQQRRFTEKYNFDVVNEKPLPGRYEWVRVSP